MNAALTEELILEVPEQALVAVQVLVCRRPFLGVCASIEFLDRAPCVCSHT